MHKKLIEMTKRQGVLAAKAVSGEKLTEDEKAELDKLNAAIAALTEDNIEIGKTELATMTVAEFKKHVEAEQAKVDMDPKRLALLKRNIEAVKGQGKTEAEDVVAVEVLAKQDEGDRITALESKVDAGFAEIKDAIKAGFDGRTSTGISDGDGDGDGGGDGDGDGDGFDDLMKSLQASFTKKGDSPTTEALATEAIDAIVKRFQAIKDKIASGEDFTVKELDEMWPGWELREMIAAAAEVLAKLDQAKSLIEEVTPKLEDMNKDSDGDSGDGDGDGDGDDGDGDDGVAKMWLGGEDLAPRAGSGKDQFQTLKKKSSTDF